VMMTDDVGAGAGDGAGAGVLVMDLVWTVPKKTREAILTPSSRSLDTQKRAAMGSHRHFAHV